MHRNGYAETSIPTIGKRLRHLAKFCDLENPRDVKRYIAAKRVKNSFKDNLCDAYGYYVRVHGLSWTRPSYQPEQRLPKTPTSEAVEKIMARASWRYATIFSLLRDTGMMPVELERTSLRDIDLKRGLINAVGCKRHIPRALKLKPSTVAMLKRYLGVNPKEYPFPKSESCLIIDRPSLAKAFRTEICTHFSVWTSRFPLACIVHRLVFQGLRVCKHLRLIAQNTLKSRSEIVQVALRIRKLYG